MVLRVACQGLGPRDLRYRVWLKVMEIAEGFVGRLMTSLQELFLF